MAESITIARPYAKAIFEYAYEKGELHRWSTLLQTMALALSDGKTKAFISNPEVTIHQQSELLLSLASKDHVQQGEILRNFIHLLAQNKRLLILPDIYVLFEALRAEQEKTLLVDVISFSEFSQEQEQRLIESLSKRLQRQVTLKITIDKSLLGGAIINAGDLVINGSVLYKLNKLKTELAA